MIRFEKVSKQFDRQWAVRELSFELPAGRCLVLVGASGCGKTTLLRLAAGFEAPDRGSIWIQDRKVSTPRHQVPPHGRSIGMVFQDLALWPHMTVEQHLSFVVSASIRVRDKQEAAIHGALAQVGLEVAGGKYPHQLSGGEKQRLALARALICRPDILLMDEPLSNLDTMLKSKVLKEIRSIIQTAGVTTIYVTHDMQEAVFIADLLAVMDNHRFQSLEPIDTHRINRIGEKSMHRNRNPLIDKGERRHGGRGC
jgi:ABC-type Fe3+/spermidine/putrescine transport system ATPase subunit